MKASESEHFDFYADQYPIIRDLGWYAGEMSYGTYRYQYHEYLCGTGGGLDGLDHLKLFLGIVTSPNHWYYGWTISYCGGMHSDRLAIPQSTPPDEVYRLARETAIDYAKKNRLGIYRTSR